MKKLVAFIFCAIAIAALAQPLTFRNVGTASFLQIQSGIVSSNSLQSYLKFENNLNDEFGDSFTDNNGVTYVSAPINQAMVGSQPDYSDPCSPIPPVYASHSSSPRFELSSSWTICCWVRITDNSLDSFIIAKSDGGSGYFIVMQGGNAYQVYAHNGTSLESVTASTFGLPPNDEYHFVTAQKTATKLRIKVDAGAWDAIRPNLETVGGAADWWRVVTGPIDAPRIDGDVALDAGEVRMADPRVVIDDLTGRVSLTRTTAAVRTLTGSINGGALTGGGSIDYQPASGLDAQLTVDVRDMALDFPDRKSTRLNSSHVSESRMPSSA